MQLSAFVAMRLSVSGARLVRVIINVYIFHAFSVPALDSELSKYALCRTPMKGSRVALSLPFLLNLEWR